MNKVLEEEERGVIVEGEVENEGEGLGEACTVLEGEQRENLNETIQSLIIKKALRKGE